MICIQKWRVVVSLINQSRELENPFDFWLSSENQAFSENMNHSKTTMTAYKFLEPGSTCFLPPLFFNYYCCYCYLIDVLCMDQCVYARVYMWRPLNPSAFVTPKTVIEHPQPEPIKSTTRSLRDVNLFNLYNRAGNSCEVRLLDMSFISCLSGYLADAVGNFGYPTINRSKILGLFCGFSEGS